MSRRRFIPILTICIAMSSASCYGEVLVQSGPLTAQGDFNLGKDKNRRSLSGIACPGYSDARHVCLVAFDEGAEARTVVLGVGEYKVDDTPIVLLPSGGEMDSEAVAADDKYYYVAGSHAVKRDGCEPNETSHHVVRIEYDPITKLPLAPETKPDGATNEIRVANVLDGFLRDSVGKCLGNPGNGFDIEGLAAYRGKLYFGLRGPTTDAEDGALAYVFESDVDPSKLLKSDPFQVKVAKGHAIRDMVAVDDGILLLIGPNDDNNTGSASPGSWSISLWKVDENADRKLPVSTVDLGDLKLWKKRDCDKEVKPEGMAFLRTNAEGNQQTYQLAIFSDGMCDGGPVIVSASRSK